jgi:hypothetical protein
MFLCISLLVIGPLVGVFGIVVNLSASLQYASQVPGLLFVGVVQSALGALVIAFGMYAGWGLLKIKPHAVTRAKTFLITYLVFGVASAALPFFAGLPAALTPALTGAAITTIFQSLVYFGVWYSYLRVSKRVKATYGPAESA